MKDELEIKNIIQDLLNNQAQLILIFPFKYLTIGENNEFKRSHLGLIYI